MSRKTERIRPVDEIAEEAADEVLREEDEADAANDAEPADDAEPAAETEADTEPAAETEADAEPADDTEADAEPADEVEAEEASAEETDEGPNEEDSLDGAAQENGGDIPDQADSGDLADQADTEDSSQPPDQTDQDGSETAPDEYEYYEVREEKPVYHPKKRSRKHKRKNRLLRLLIAAAVVCAFVFVAHLPYFQITEIPVIGNKAVTDETILKKSGIKEGNSIFLLNTWSIKNKIKKNRYISEVEINRIFPGTVEIIVKEREAAAQLLKITKKGKLIYIITDANGMVMDRTEERQDVTFIEYVNVEKAAKGDNIRVDDPGTFGKAMELIAAAKQGDLYFKRIAIKGSMVDAYIFDELVCKGRFDNLIASLGNSQLKAVVYRLYQEDISKGTINIGENNYCSFTP